LTKTHLNYTIYIEIIKIINIKPLPVILAVDPKNVITGRLNKSDIRYLEIKKLVIR